MDSILHAEAIDPANPSHRAMLKDLQGNILRGHGRDHVRLAFFRVQAGKEDEARSFLGDYCRKNLRSASDQEQEREEFKDWEMEGSKGPHPGKLFANVFLTHAAYKDLQLTQIPADPAFTRNKVDTASKLNDPLILKWAPNYNDIHVNPIHAMILLAHHDEQVLDTELANLGKAVRGFAGHFEERGTVLRKDNKKDGLSIEHFGFPDGLSQPLFFKEDQEKARASDKNPNAAGGYPSRIRLGLVLVKDPGNKDPDAYGSYLVFRKLEQDKVKFMKLTEEMADSLDEKDPELAAAYTVGRSKMGTPLVLDGFKVGMNSTVVNDFTYMGDTFGNRCPRPSHIRKVNPRRPGAGEQNPRIVRRGIPYDDTQAGIHGGAAGAGLGLLFLCFQAGIAGQFEAIQREANDLFDGLDPICGQVKDGGPPGAQKWPAQWGSKDKDKEEFPFHGVVTMKGAEYFFAPSLSFLKSL